jgi:hypothetical protein
MARIYAGILGLLAFATAMACGIVQSGSPSETISQACKMMFAFTAVGYLIGRTAQWIVDDAVRGRLLNQMAHKPTGEPGP